MIVACRACFSEVLERHTKALRCAECRPKDRPWPPLDEEAHLVYLESKRDGLSTQAAAAAARERRAGQREVA